MRIYSLLLFLFFLYTNTSTSVAQAYDDPTIRCVNQCVKACFPASLPTPSPPPPSPSRRRPPPDQPAPPQQPTPPTTQQSSMSPMTRNFPLGSCKMAGPSLPYELKFTKNVPGQVCFTIKVVDYYKEICESLNILAPCEDMITNFNKIVFWYKQTNECGFQYTIPKKHLNMFPWYITGSKGNQQQAARYRFFPPMATKARAVGDLSLFKYEWKQGNRTVSSIEMNINRSVPFKSPNDTTLDNYLMCIDYNATEFNLMNCITNSDNIIKYSFYDPYKSLCTVGVLAL